jgi:hypothetical protein
MSSSSIYISDVKFNSSQQVYYIYIYILTFGNKRNWNFSSMVRHLPPFPKVLSSSPPSPLFFCTGLFFEDVGPTWFWWPVCGWASKRVRLGWRPGPACHAAGPGCRWAGGPDQQPAWCSAGWGGAWWTTNVALMWRPGLLCQVYTRDKIMFKKGENHNNTQENFYPNGLYLCKVVKRWWV